MAIYKGPVIKREWESLDEAEKAALEMEYRNAANNIASKNESNTPEYLYHLAEELRLIAGQRIAAKRKNDPRYQQQRNEHGQFVGSSQDQTPENRRRPGLFEEDDFSSWGVKRNG